MRFAYGSLTLLYLSTVKMSRSWMMLTCIYAIGMSQIVAPFPMIYPLYILSVQMMGMSEPTINN